MPTPKGLKRRQAIIEAAKAVFIENGYANTTISMIIERSGGSRTSLYDNFTNKEGLLANVIEYMVAEIFLQMESHEYENNIEGVLSYYGERFLRAVLDPQAIGLVRLVFAETTNHPEIGIQFMKQGPSKCYEALYEKLCSLPELQEFPANKIKQITVLFLEAIKGPLFLQALCLPDKPICDHDILESLQLGVTFTLAHFKNSH